MSTIPLPIWTSVVATHRKFVAMQRDMPGDSPHKWPSGTLPLYQLCGLCGTLTLIGHTSENYNPKDPDQFKLRLVMPDRCPACQTIHDYEEGIFTWVMHVVGNHAKWYQHVVSDSAEIEGPDDTPQTGG